MTTTTLRVAGATALLGAALLASTAHSEAPTGASPTGVTPAGATIAPEAAIARAVNNLSATNDGFLLHHPRHTARFTADGLSLSPRRGPSWSWHLAEVRAGNASLALDRAAQPAEREGMEVYYARGGFEEQYLFGDDHVEQQFVLEQPVGPRGSDLVIRGEVRCAGTLEAASQGWVWRGDDGVVSLGQVHAFDAAGRTLAASMSVQSSAIEIQLDGQDLADAAYPVTIDPEIGTNDFRISDMGPDGDITYDGQKAAVAYNSVNNQYLVVWEGDDNVGGLSDGEFEIFGQRIDGASGAELGSNDFRLSDMGPNGDTTYDAVSPDVAYNSVNNEYLVVWSGDDGGTLANGEFEIYGQRVAGATGLEVGTNDFRISDLGPDGDPLFDADNPAITYNSGQNEYLVVWSGDDNTGGLLDEETEIWGQRLAGATGAQVGTNDFRISDMGGDTNVLFDAENPAVCYAQPRAEYLVVWSGDDNTGALVNGEFEIWGQRLNATTGAEVGTNDFRISDMGPDGNDAYDAVNPSVAFATTENRYLVVWSGDDSIAPLVEGEREIFGQLIDATTGAETGTNDARLSTMGQDGDPKWDARNPSVGYSPAQKEFLVTWAGDDKGGGLDAGEFEIFGQRVSAASGAQVGSDDFVMSEMGRPGFTNVGASEPVVAVNTAAAEYMVMWHADQDTLGLVDDEFEIYGQRIRASNGNELGTNDARYSDMGPDGDVDFDARSAHVAYNGTRNEYLVVWEGDDNTAPLAEGETEIFGQIVDASTGAELGTNDFRISDMGPDGDATYDAQKPTVAYNSSNHEYLVVWSGEDNTAPLVRGEFEIFGQRLDAVSGAQLGTNDFRISDMGTDGDANYDALSPAVTYNPALNQYLVVWEGDDNASTTVEGESEIYGQRLAGSTGAELGTNDFRISDMGPDGDINFDALVPAVVCNTSANEYLVTWAGEDNTGLMVSGEFEIYGQRLSSVGAEIGTNDFRISDMGVDGDPLLDGFAPAVAYDDVDNQYLVVWHGQNNFGILVPGETEIWGQRLSAAGAELGTNDFRISDMGPDGDGTFDAVYPSVAYDHSTNEYLVVWEGDDDTFPVVNGENEIWGQLIAANTGVELGSNDFRLSDMGVDGDGFSDASVPSVAYAGLAGQYLVIWHGDDQGVGMNPDEFEIYGQRFALTVPSAVGDAGAAAMMHLAIGPNPARAYVHVQLAGVATGSVDLTLFDITGRARLERKLTLSNGAGGVDLDARELPVGVYIVRARASNATAAEKLIVTR